MGSNLIRKLAKYLGLVGLIVLSQSPAAADTQATIGELEAKSAACTAVSPRTHDSKACAERCAGYAHRLKDPTGLKPGDYEQMLQACETLHSRVDFDYAPPSETVVISMAQDMLARANACLSVMPRTRETADCHRLCNYLYQVRPDKRPGVTMGFLNDLRDSCEAAYAAAGFNPAAATPTPETPTAEKRGIRHERRVR